MPPNLCGDNGTTKLTAANVSQFNHATIDMMVSLDGSKRYPMVRFVETTANVPFKKHYRIGGIGSGFKPGSAVVRSGLPYTPGKDIDFTIQ